MRVFFLRQMDYIFFIYGLAFILLFSVCIFLQRQHKTNIPWDFLGLFGLIHGLNEWMDMLALNLGDSEPFQWARLAMMASSFICLLEFGRLGCERLKNIKLGRWIYLPLILAVFSAVPSGALGLNVVVRYSLGLTGGLWAATALWFISRKSQTTAFAAGIAAAAMTVYALAAGFIVPKADWLFATVANQDSFLKISGFPIQLLRGLAACVIALMIWHYHEKLRAEKIDPPLTIHEKKLTIGLALALIFVLGFGWIWTDLTGQREVVAQRTQLLTISQQVVTTMDPELVQSLEGSANDLETPAYQIVKARLQHLHNTITSVRFLYLMKKVDGKIVFLADSEPAGSKDESPPGQVFNESTPKLEGVFASGKGTVDDPTKDRWGTWISAYSPLNDGRTGTLVAVFGVDQSARDFNLAVAHARVKCIFFVGLMSSFVLFLFIYGRRFSEIFKQRQEGSKKDQLLHWGMAVILSLLGATLTFSLFLELRRNAWDSFQTTFTQRAISRAQSVSQELERQIDRLDGLRRFLDSQDAVDRNEFSQYAAPLLKGVPVRALEWIPRVTHEQRLFYESSAKQDGLDGFQIFERDVQGRKIPVLNRGEYFPVYFLEPLKGNETATGFDLASDPVRRSAMETSRDTGRPAATPPLVLVQDGQKKTGVLVFMPVYSKDLPRHTIAQRRKSLRGFALAVYNADELLKGIYSRMPPEGLACLIEDLAAASGNRVLYRHAIRDGAVDWIHPLRKYEMPLDMPDRQWRVTIVPGTAFIERYLSKAYWWILPVGLFLSVLVTAFLSFMAAARYRAESLARLRTKEKEKYSSLVDNLNIGVYRITPGEHGRVLEANPAMVAMFEADSKEEFLRHSVSDFYRDPSRRKEFSEKMLRLGHLRNEELELRTLKGRFFWAFVTATKKQAENGEAYFDGMIEDVSERKRAEAALRESEKRFMDVLYASQDAILLIDTEKFVDCNEATARMLGYASRDKFLMTHPSELSPSSQPDGRHSFEKANEMMKIAHEKGFHRFEWMHRKANGVSFPVEVSLTPILLLGKSVLYCVWRDITKRKRTEEELAKYRGHLEDLVRERTALLQASEERYKKIASSITDYIYTVSIEKGKIVDTVHGSGCIGVTGYSAEEFRSQSMLWISMVPEEDKQKVLEQVRQALSGKNPSPIEHRIIKKDGTLRWVISRIILRFDKEGNLAAYEGVIGDITERKQAEALLLDSRKQAEAANKAKSQFLANMSHEIRTPMNAVIGFSELLENTTLNRTQKDYVDTIRESSQMLMLLINDILDVSKIEAGELKLEDIDFDLPYLLKSVIKMNSARMEKKNVKLLCSIDEGMPQSYKGDPTRIRQILVNLISNAIKFTEKGEINVSVKAGEGSSVASGGRRNLQFSVKDTGIGIPKEQHQRIFEAFEQADATTTRKYGGTGLGLTISKTLVAMMGGKIWIESTPGVGSEFFFTLNLEEAVATAQKDITPIKAADLKGKKVLIVDDNEDASRMLAIYCLEAGMDILYKATSAEEALEWLRRQTTLLPEILLSDVMMPGMDGHELAREIKKSEKTQAIKLVAVTSDAKPGAAKDAEKAGFDAFLPKPVSKNDLIEIMRAVLGDKRHGRGEDQIVTRHMAEELSCKGLRILVVEDNPVNQKLLKVSLKILGCDVDVASNGQIAVEKVKTTPYDLVLMDIQMPVMGGCEATEIIRSQINKTIPILALTAAVLKEDEQKSLAAGMNDFITKPAELTRLREKIIQWAGRPKP